MDVTFRLASSADIPQMIALWKLCFPEDDEAYIHRFLDKTPIEQGVLACKGKVLSMLFLLPATAVVDDTAYSVRYLYAGCTHPAYRGEGIFAELLRFARHYVEEVGEYGIYLCPASSSLAAYYEKQGYLPEIGGWLSSGSVVDTSLKTVTVDEYMDTRNKFLSMGQPYFRLDKQTERFFMEELRADGWQFLTSNDGCCLLSRDGAFAYDCLGVFPAASCYGSAVTGVRQNTAWWIPCKNKTALVEALSDREAYTAFLGDI